MEILLHNYQKGLRVPNTNMRRTLTIIAAVIVLGGLGVWVYFSYFANQAGITVAPKQDISLPSSSSYSPINTTATGAPQTATTSVTAPSAPVAGPRLVKISDGPVVSSPVVYRNASTTIGFFVNYIERQSGNVFSYSSATRSSTRTSNKTLPGIQSAVWQLNAQTAFVRYLTGTDSATVNTYALPANGIGGFFLEQNIADIAVSSAGILTLASGVNGSVASVRRTDGTRVTEVFSTPLSSLRVAFAGKNRLAFTKPSIASDGAAFLVDSTGRFSRIAGPLNGLVSMPSPSGAHVLVSYTSGGTMRMELVESATGAVTQLPVATIADKCVWTSDNASIYCGIPVNPSTNHAYPDDWYQGAIAFTDRIWKINVAGRYAELVLDFSKENDTALDAVALSVDPIGQALAFINKRNGSLWVFSL